MEVLNYAFTCSRNGPRGFLCLFVGSRDVAQSLQVGVKGELRLRVEGYRIRNQANYHENMLKGLFQDRICVIWTG